MPIQSEPPAAPDERTTLLLGAVGLLVKEIALLAAEDWEQLPALKKHKVVTASRLRHLRAETEAADGVPSPTLEMLIAELEIQTQGQIRARLDLIGNQILALQELSLYLRETLSVSLRSRAKRPLGNSDVLG